LIIDNFSKPIERNRFVEREILVPKKLEKRLPYELKTKHLAPKEKLARDGPLANKHTAVILEPHESKVPLKKFVVFPLKF